MRLLYHNLQLNSLKPHLLSHVLSGEPTANQGPPQPLKKDEKDNLLKKKKLERVRENLKKNGKKKRGLSLRILPRRSSFDDKPFIRSRHALSKQINIWTE